MSNCYHERVSESAVSYDNSLVTLDCAVKARYHIRSYVNSIGLSVLIGYLDFAACQVKCIADRVCFLGRLSCDFNACNSCFCGFSESIGYCHCTVSINACCCCFAVYRCGNRVGKLIITVRNRCDNCHGILLVKPGCCIAVRPACRT